MFMKNKSLLSVLVLLLLCTFLLACRSSSTQPTKPQSDNPNSTTSYTTKVKIKTPDDKDVVEIKIGSNDTKIEYNGKVVRGEMKDSDKRKYVVEGSGQIAEVKMKDADGFKVRTNDGKLLWKIKISDSKIKISDNEENQNAFELVKREDGAKVEQNEKKFGEVKFYKDRQKVKVKDASDKELFDSNTDRYSVAYGVLLLDKIPEELRYIIIAELLARNL